MSEEVTTTKYVHPHVRASLIGLKIWFVSIVTVAVLGTLAWILYLNRDAFKGWGWEIALTIQIGWIIGLICLVGFPMITLARYATKANDFEIGEFGTAIRDGVGRTRVYAPMTTNQVKISQNKKKVMVVPEVPTIIELIDTGVIAVGQLAMHMGFEQTKGGLVPLIDAWPGTFAIAGMGRSGKTRRVITIVMQAILGGARIYICDPHAKKKDGLGKILAPLAPWITIVEGPEGIVEISKAFVREMKRRKAEGGDNLQPWIIIYDEWSDLMGDNDISDDDKAIMIEVVEDCSALYAGFNGFAGIIGQKWLNDECGGTTIRRLLHKVFVHRIHPDFASYFLKAKYAKVADDLLVKECFYKVNGGETKKIVTITVPDDAAEWFAGWLEDKQFATLAIQGGAVNRQQLPEHATKMDTVSMVPPTYREAFRSETMSENANWRNTQELTLILPEDLERLNAPVAPPETPESRMKVQELAPETPERVVRQPDDLQTYDEVLAYYSEAHEEVIRAMFDLAKQKGHGNYTRGDLMKHLGWSNYRQRILKLVCDHYRVAMPKGA
jgi:hypothetical protein